MTYDRFDVVIVPFPFTDQAWVKRRPALVVSGGAFNKKAAHVVMAMITSVNNPPWPLDVAVSALSGAGLPAPSVVRMKLFTLDHRFVIARCGSLSGTDRKAVGKALKTALEL